MLDITMLGTRAIRLVRQTEIAECGLASLAMVAGFHGLNINLVTLRRSFAPSPRGMPLRSLMVVADQIGLTPRAVKLPLEALGDLHLPAILHWDHNHYVVLQSVQGQTAMVLDPAGTGGRMSLDDVARHFTGVALELRKSHDFRSGNRSETLRMRDLWDRTTRLGRALLQTAILSVVMTAYSLALPYYTQIAIDSVLPALDVSLLTVLATGFGLFMLFDAVASLLRSFVLLAAGSAVGYGISVNLGRKLFRLPLDWYERRHVGDILARFRSIKPIQDFLTQGAVSAALDGILGLFILAVMIVYSGSLAALAVAATAAYAAIRILSVGLERSANQAAIIERGEEQTSLIESLRGMQTLRLANRETFRHAIWQNRLTDAVNAEIRVARVGIWQHVANLVIFGVEAILSIWLSVRFVMEGGFSVGMVFAYAAYKSQFITRATTLVDQAIAFRMLSLHLDRLADIVVTPDDPSFGTNELREGRLEGKIELRGIFYRYSPSEPLVLSNVDLIVEAGEHVAITGPSGSGKTTLSKIILGLIEPEEGEVLADGQKLSRFGYRNYRRQVATVMQDDTLFAGSLMENIALFDEAIDQDHVVACAKAAQIHDDIGAMTLGYDTLVGDMGSTLSGGQRQRVLLARALYRRPRMILMDEGTAHLDLGHELAVNASIRRLGITRIVIAHRQETLAAADRIIRIENGSIQTIS